jgi:putative addiction module component (TIGR02574 family)
MEYGIIRTVTAETKQLLAQALELPEPERADLAASLIASLEGQADADCEAAWREETARRVAALDGGSVKAVLWADAMGRIRAR